MLVNFPAKPFAVSVLLAALVGAAPAAGSTGSAGGAVAGLGGRATVSSVSDSQHLPPTYVNWPLNSVNWPCPATPSYKCAKGGYDNQAALNSGWPNTYYGDTPGHDYASTNNYGVHNCTLYAAFRLKENGFKDPGKSWGNASNWALAASKAKGVVVNQTPAVGAIAQWNVGDGGLGHVAYVESVTRDSAGAVTAIVISEDNFMPESFSSNPALAGGYTAQIRITAGAKVWPANFIHATAAPSPTPKPSASWHVAWQSPTVSVLGIACPTSAECLAVGAASRHGYVLRTTNGGKAWTATTVSAHVGLFTVACADAEQCVAGGNGGKVAVTANGGQSWSEVSLPYVDSPLAAVDAVACAPGGMCYAAAAMTRYSGTVIYGSADGGQSWAFESLPANSVNAMTCLTGTACIGVGSVPPTSGAIIWPAASQATSDGWASSSTGSFPRMWKSLTGVACLTASLCYAGGSDLNNDGGKVLATTNFGQTWSAVADGGIAPWSLSCPTSSTCTFGSEQSVSTTTDGGQTWARTTISRFPSSDYLNVVSLACAGPGQCMAVENGSMSAIVTSY